MIITATQIERESEEYSDYIYKEHSKLLDRIIYHIFKEKLKEINVDNKIKSMMNKAMRNGHKRLAV